VKVSTVIRKPFPTEWGTSLLPNERRAYLDSGMSFEEMVARLLGETQVVRSTICPYEQPAPGEAKQAREARQITFLIQAGPETCDLLYNAPDGLRGRYWQSPDHGSAATRHLINSLAPTLAAFAEQTSPASTGKAASMTVDDIRASLDAPSAKVWPWEGDHKDRLKVDHQLMVPRWREAEERAPSKDMWRRNPTGRELEIKGAIIGLDRTEYIPEGKRDRSCQIFQFGFTWRGIDR